MRRKAAAAATGLCLLAAGGCGSEDPVPARGDFVGLVTEDVFAGDHNYRQEALAKQAEAGVGLIRQTFDWSRIEVERGRFDFSVYDSWMEDVAGQRMRVLPILFNPPAFYSSRPPRGAKRGTYPPRRAQDISGFATALVERYGPDGSFWDDKDVPRTPIRSWQVWNEPNIRAYWPSGPDAREYVALLRAAAGALERADPGAEIVAAGLPNSRRGIPYQRYLTELVAAGVGEDADAIAVHPYARDVAGTIKALRDTRRTLASEGVEKPLWVTEIGWATQGPPSPFTVGMRGQAERITRLFDRIAELRKELDLRGVVYYNWRDSKPFEGGFDFFGLHTGLLTLNGVEKPGFVALQRAAQRFKR